MDIEKDDPIRQPAPAPNPALHNLNLSSTNLPRRFSNEFLPHGKAGFFQSGPNASHPLLSNRMLQSYLKRSLPQTIQTPVLDDLNRFGERAIGEVHQWGEDAERNPPQLVRHEPWGRRIDEVRVSRGWSELDSISAEEGLVAIGYERPYGEHSRTYQFAKIFLFVPHAANYACPLAMTDGAARLLELYGDAELKQNAFRRLTSRDPAQFWTSGQWMTERAGGSDVGNSETIAVPQADGSALLFGHKWFTSAITSQMAMTLARPAAADGTTVDGSKGLGLYYLETHAADGTLNGIEVDRLKDKLGTHALPTAELTLHGTVAKRVAPAQHAVKSMSTLFNVTRIYNAVSAVAMMSHGLSIAKDYALQRNVFGKPLAEQPLHNETLAALEVENCACLLLVFKAVELLGKEETGVASPAQSALLRLLTPIVKLYTGKKAVACASEVLESIGGVAYCEDSGLPRLLRDAQVLPIWEGTTNVLSLDVLRAAAKDGGLSTLFDDADQRLASVVHESLKEDKLLVSSALAQLKGCAAAFSAARPEDVEAGAREFSMSIARTYAAVLLLEHAEWSLGAAGSLPAAENQDAIVAKRFCAQQLCTAKNVNPDERDQSRKILYG